MAATASVARTAVMPAVVTMAATNAVMTAIVDVDVRAIAVTAASRVTQHDEEVTSESTNIKHVVKSVAAREVVAAGAAGVEGIAAAAAEANRHRAVTTAEMLVGVGINEPALLHQAGAKGAKSRHVVAIALQVLIALRVIHLVGRMAMIQGLAQIPTRTRSSILIGEKTCC